MMLIYQFCCLAHNYTNVYSTLIEYELIFLPLSLNKFVHKKYIHPIQVYTSDPAFIILLQTKCNFKKENYLSLL